MTRETLILVITGVIACLVGLGMDLSFARAKTGMITGLYGLVILLFVSAVHGVDRSRRLGILFTLFGITTAIVLAAEPGTMVAPICLVVLVTLFPHFFTKPQSWALFALTNIILVTVLVLTKDSMLELSASLSFVGFQVFSLISAMLRLLAQQQKDALEKAHLDLLSAQNMLEEKSKSDERIRIARDIHDGIGQRLTALSLNIEHAKHRQPDDLGAYLTGLKGDVTGTLNDLRHLVSAFRRKDTVDIAGVVKRLAGKIETLTFTSDGPLVLIDAELTDHMIFCLQEGISNALRHGGATAISLKTSRGGDTVTVLLTDNGTFKQNTDTVGGSGLKGMTERLAPYGGTVSLEDSPAGGTALSLILPTRHLSLEQTGEAA